jgi:hypothetical protein
MNHLRQFLGKCRASRLAKNMSELPQIYLVTEVETSEVEVRTGERSSDDTGGGFGPLVTKQVTTMKTQRVPLDAAALKVQRNGLLQVIGALFDQAEQMPNGMVLDEMNLSVEINAEGQVSIMGNGGKLGNKGTIALRAGRR